ASVVCGERIVGDSYGFGPDSLAVDRERDAVVVGEHERTRQRVVEIGRRTGTLLSGNFREWQRLMPQVPVDAIDARLPRAGSGVAAQFGDRTAVRTAHGHADVRGCLLQVEGQRGSERRVPAPE